MICDKGIAIKFVVAVLLCVFVWGEVEVRCIEREREALLRFKNGLTDEHGILSSWRLSDECCKWYGVVCSNTTGHVIRLELGAIDFDGVLGGEVSSSLLELHHLYYLDLSYNDFGGDPIPEFIGSMKQLQHLKLESCNFSGIVPSQLGNLTNLRTLDLSYNSLSSTNLNWLSTLSLLSNLDLSHTNWLQQIPKSLGDLTHLRVLVLYDNDLRGHLDEFIGNLSTKGMSVSLEILDLAHNQLTGSVPDLRAFSALTELYLGNNKLMGSMPGSLGQLSKLQILDVSHNSLEGTVSESHFIKLHNLETLDLSFNSLELQIAPDWSPPFQLGAIFLAGCNVGPSFPKWIQIQRNLSRLDLSSAGIIDEAPMWLWSLSPSLQNLFLSHNQISGTIPDLSSTSILRIDVTSNKFSGSIPLFHNNSRNIQLNQNMFSGSISSICKIPHNSLLFLGLSNNQLSGELPNCWEKIPILGSLDLANNGFSGQIPHSFGSLHHLYALQLRDNNLSGELPSTLRFCQELKLMDVGGNELTGGIPVWIGEIHQMEYLNLGSNRLHDSVPPGICNLTHIRILDMGINNLSGKIPDCFNNFTTLAHKNTSQTLYVFGFRYKFQYNLQLPNVFFKYYEEYSSVGWKGQESEYKDNLNLLRLIDFSSNRLTGNIPESFSNMRGLKSLNLSRNSLTGNIIPDIGQMEMLESLDLSKNQLSGEIPTSLAQLHYLSFLDLSNNNLSGKIPSSTQLQSFNTSSYARNNGLCGRPLTILCPEDSPRPPTTTKGGKTNERDDGFWSLSFMQEFGISMAFGFIFGFWGVVGSFILKKSWRNAYFYPNGEEAKMMIIFSL